MQIINNQGEHEKDLETLMKGYEYTILYFYPKDNTPGCTIEAQEFTCLKEDFDKLGVLIVGVSKDSAKSHGKFIEKIGINFNLISDEDLELHNKYGTWVEKSMYGKKYMGTQRSTFILNKKGNIIKDYIGVSAKGHAKTVLEDIEKLVK